VQAASRLKTRLLFALLGVVGGWLFLALQPAQAQAAIKLGVYSGAEGQPTALFDAPTLDRYISMVGRKPDIVMDYSNVTDPLLTQVQIANIQSHAVTPMVTWQLYHSGWSGPTISLEDLAAGGYDSSLRESAQLAKTLPFEIMIRFGHEMNGYWYGWSGTPTAYVAAWRHIVSVFREEGVTNVKWVWSPNVDYGDLPFTPYFPGDEWVDYVALDGYNWGTSGVGRNTWQSLSEVFSASYRTLTELSTKPVIIAETGSSEIGGDKAAWIREGFLTTIPQAFPRVEAVIWFNRDMEQDWRVNSSAASLEAFRSVVSSTLYGGTVGGESPDTGGGTGDDGSETPTASTDGGSGDSGGDGSGVRPGKGKGRNKNRPVKVRSLRVTRRVRLAAHAGGPARRGAPRLRGRISYHASRQAKVRIAIQRRTRGGGYRRRVVIVRQSRTGRTRLPFSRLKGCHLRPGAYRVVVTAADHGERSPARRAHFRVV